MDKPSPFAGHLGSVTAAGYFDTALSDAVRALKYRRLAAIAGPLAARIVAGAATWPEDALVVPVPAHAERVKERGIDHARVLARELAQHSGLRAAPHLLRRTRNTASQTGLSREKRRLNLRGAFEAERHVRGCSVVLVDDVLTTGSTALACAEALISAGAIHVDLCVVAIADRFVA